MIHVCYLIYKRGCADLINKTTVCCTHYLSYVSLRKLSLILLPHLSNPKKGDFFTDVVELDLIGSDDVDGHIHLVISD